MRVRPFALALIVFALITVFSSCAKKYVCQCVISYSGEPGLPDTVVKQYDVTDTKSKAKSECTGNSGKYVNGVDTTVENCYLY